MQKFLYQDLFRLEKTHWWHIAKRKTVKNLLKRHLKKRKGKILDIGCGTGKNMESLQDFGTVWGIDSSSEAIKFCQKRGLKNLKLGRAEKTKFPANFFDLVTLLDVLEHTDDNKALLESKRILKQKALLVVTVPAFPILWSKWDEVLHHKRRYTKSSLKNLLENNGFKILNLSYMHSYLLLPYLIIRPIKSIFFPVNYSSDFKINSPLINRLFTALANLERAFVMKGFVPLGLSLVVVAQKDN